MEELVDDPNLPLVMDCSVVGFRFMEPARDAQVGVNPLSRRSVPNTVESITELRARARKNPQDKTLMYLRQSPWHVVSDPNSSKLQSLWAAKIMRFGMIYQNVLRSNANNWTVPDGYGVYICANDLPLPHRKFKSHYQFCLVSSSELLGSPFGESCFVQSLRWAAWRRFSRISELRKKIVDGNLNVTRPFPTLTPMKVQSSVYWSVPRTRLPLLHDWIKEVSAFLRDDWIREPIPVYKDDDVKGKKHRMKYSVSNLFQELIGVYQYKPSFYSKYEPDIIHRLKHCHLDDILESLQVGDVFIFKRVHTSAVKPALSVLEPASNAAGIPTKVVGDSVSLRTTYHRAVDVENFDDPFSHLLLPDLPVKALAAVIPVVSEKDSDEVRDTTSSISTFVVPCGYCIRKSTPTSFDGDDDPTPSVESHLPDIVDPSQSYVAIVVRVPFFDNGVRSLRLLEITSSGIRLSFLRPRLAQLHLCGFITAYRPCRIESKLDYNGHSMAWKKVLRILVGKSADAPTPTLTLFESAQNKHISCYDSLFQFPLKPLVSNVASGFLRGTDESVTLDTATMITHLLWKQLGIEEAKLPDLTTDQFSAIRVPDQEHEKADVAYFRDADIIVWPMKQGMTFKDAFSPAIWQQQDR